MQQRYKIHHLGILCDDLAANVDFYTHVLGHQICAKVESAERNSVWVGSGSSLFLELIGAPFTPAEQAWHAQRGAGFHHLAFEVENLDASWKQLIEAGLDPIHPPSSGPHGRSFMVWDDSRVPVEVVQGYTSIQPANVGPQPAEFLLHHFDIFSDNWQRTKAFYAQHFGFRSVFEYIYDHGGAFIYLADSYFDAGSRQAMIEVIGPSYEETREFEFSEKFGTGMDHIGYVVQDVKQAHQIALERGSADFVQPYADYGTEMCWVQDANGADLELMLPVNAKALQKAFKTGIPFRPNSK